MPKILEHFSWTFDHFIFFKSSGKRDGVKKPNTFSEANARIRTAFKKKWLPVVSKFSDPTPTLL